MKLRALTVGALAWLSCAAGFAEVNFVQVTDAHMFDGKGQVQENEKALRWCVTKINARMDGGANYKFVVFTGDLGVEGLADISDQKAEQGAIHEASRQLAEIIKDSKVKRWLFLPGNNDLVDENPATIGVFHNFVKVLQAQASTMAVVDFCPMENDPSSGILAEGTCRFIGFNNASFKSNDSGTNAAAFEASQLKNLEEVRARLAAPGPRYAYIFYHIPEIDDPYYAYLDPSKSEERKKLKNRANKRGEFGKEFPFSAWTVTPTVRTEWNRIVANDRVKGLFAGHFHSSKRSIYEGLGWIRSSNYPSGSLMKLRVCPPVASKNQENDSIQARGFQEISIDSDSGEIKSKIFWYEKSSSAHPVKNEHPHCTSNRETGVAKAHSIIESVESVGKTLAILVGGWWTWLTFVRKRVKFPSARVEHAIKHWADEQLMLLHVTLRVTNTGNVLLPIGECCTWVEQLTPLPDSVRNQMLAGKDPVESSRTDIEWTLIAERKLDPTAGYEIEPGEAEEFHFDFMIDQNVSRVLIYSYLENKKKRRWPTTKTIGWNISTIYDMA